MVATFLEMLELRYLWRQSVRMDNAKPVALPGQEPMTPLDEALATTLQGLGCLAQHAQATLSRDGDHFSLNVSP